MTYYQRHVEREILSAMADGELDPEQRRFLHDHLASCDACRELADEFGAVVEIVAELPKLAAPEGFVAEALDAKPPMLTRRRRFVALGVAAAALGISLAGLVTPSPASEPPVDVFVERHVQVSDGVGGQVLLGVDP